MLTMSCNQPYFQSLLGTVRDTWAKPLIHNKYKNITWFSYTSCDNKHPKPCVDFEEHMIYVDCEDDLVHSYEKTQKAYNMIKDVVDFDFVIRTNTSVFVNIDNMIEKVNSLSDDSVMGNWYGYVCEQNRDIKFFLLIGFFYGMCREFFEYGISADNDYIKDKDGNPIPSNDDVIFSKRLVEFIGGNYSNPQGINPDDKIPIYKAYKPGSEDQFDELKTPHNFNFTFNPEDINDNVMVRVRTLYKDMDRIEYGHEIEHMYELYNALK